MTCVHPKIGFLDMIAPTDLPADFVTDIQRWKTRSGIVKINVAMSELPDFTAMPGKDLQEHHTGSVELCFSPQYAERAFQDAHMDRKAVGGSVRRRRHPDDDGQEARARGNARVLDVQPVGARRLGHEPHRDELDAYAKRIFDLYDELAPNFKDAIIDYQVIGPYDMEQELGLIGGNIFHGELSVDQLFHMRPAPGYADFRTPIKGLYHGSSATHAGGGVNGIPGWKAYRAAVKDRALKKRS